jgi:AraC-like DNA-binding protein
VILAGKVIYDYANKPKKHAHPFSEIILLQKGRARIIVEDNRLAAKQGDIIYYPPSTLHYEIPEGDTRLELAYICGNCETAPREHHLLNDNSGRIFSLAQWIIEEKVSAYQKKVDILNALFKVLIEELIKLTSFGHDDRIHAIRDYLSTTIGEKHTVQELAARAELSRYYFIRKYKAITGRTPIEDLIILRLEAASNLLATTHMPLKAIALSIGFCDEYYFSKAFHRHFGVSPGSYRKSHISI